MLSQAQRYLNASADLIFNKQVIRIEYENKNRFFRERGKVKFQEISITSLLFCTDYFLISVGFLFQVTDAPKRGLIVGGIV